jgi:methyltransferase family protein
MNSSAVVPADSIRRVMPAPIRSALRPVLAWSRDLRFQWRYGFPPPPAGTDLVGYEALIEFFQRRGLANVPGDVVEIGAFKGGGTYKLAKFLQKHRLQKKVYTIDCFDTQFDVTKTVDAMTMAEYYERQLAGKCQRAIFDEVTAGMANIVVIADDSKRVNLSAQALSFAFIDGNHSDEYVINDYYLAWNKLSPRGVVAFHDYGFDLPNVTSTIDHLCDKHSAEIEDISVDSRRHIIYIPKRAISSSRG